jgi:preprotein translocase subunit Sec61beta
LEAEPPFLHFKVFGSTPTFGKPLNARPYHSLEERHHMAKEKKGEGFHSAAGLIRYFDAEEKTAFKISPTAVIILTLLTIVAIFAVKIMWPVAPVTP